MADACDLGIVLGGAHGDDPGPEGLPESGGIAERFGGRGGGGSENDGGFLKKICPGGGKAGLLRPGHGVGSNPAGFALEQGGDRFFDRLLDAGDIGHQRGGGEMRENGLNQGGENGRRGSEENEIGTTNEGRIRSDVGVWHKLADGRNRFGPAGPEGQLSLGKGLGGGKGGGTSDESRSEDGDTGENHFLAGRSWGRAFSSRAICSGVPMEIRIHVGRR